MSWKVKEGAIDLAKRGRDGERLLRLGLFAWSDVADGQMAGEEPNIWIIKGAWALISSCCLSWSKMRHTGFDKERKACKPPGRWEKGLWGVASRKQGQKGKGKQREERRRRVEREGLFWLFLKNWAAPTTRKPGECQCTNEKRGVGWEF